MAEKQWFSSILCFSLTKKENLSQKAPAAFLLTSNCPSLDQPLAEEIGPLGPIMVHPLVLGTQLFHCFSKLPGQFLFLHQTVNSSVYFLDY